MTQSIIDIPAPAPEDSETVAAALETAAIFGARGDAAEALRWLKRAAESASDSGDDVRTLSLARLAADISSQLHTGPGNRDPRSTRQLPKPPPRPAPSSGRSPSLTSEGPSAASEQESEQKEGSVPPPSILSPPRPRVQSAERVDADAEAPPSRRYSPPSSRHSPPSSRLPAAQRASASAERGPSPHRAPVGPSAIAAQGESLGALDSIAPPEPAPEPAVTAPPVSFKTEVIAQPSAESLAVAVVEPQPEAETASESESRPTLEAVGHPAPDLETASSAPRLRKAARVSVVPSSNEPGLFLVRLLDDDGALPINAAEALLVLIDPDSEVFPRGAG